MLLTTSPPACGSLEGDAMHAVEAIEDTRLLVTVLFNKGGVT